MKGEKVHFDPLMSGYVKEKYLHWENVVSKRVIIKTIILYY